MRAREFTLKENTVVSGDMAVVSQPLGTVVKRIDTPNTDKYKNTQQKKPYKNAIRKP